MLQDAYIGNAEDERERDGQRAENKDMKLE